MLNSKDRAKLRGLANTIQPILQVGKGGISENLIIQIIDALEARELIKITVLQNADETPRDIAENLAYEAGCEVVQVVGNKVTLYKPSANNPKNLI